MNQIFTADAIVLTYEYEAEINGQLQRIVLTPTTKVDVELPSPQQAEFITGVQINEPYAVVVPFVR
jgi:hypothetical protein